MNAITEKNKIEKRTNLLSQPTAFDLHKNIKDISRLYKPDAQKKAVTIKSSNSDVKLNFTKKYDNLVE